MVRTKEALGRSASPDTAATQGAGALAGVGRFPRARLAHTPTPLERAPNLGAVLGIELWIKRDDCTGLALGGNKVRQIEFHFGAAQAAGADTMLVTGAVQSNLVRIAAAGARRLGMEIEIQLEERVEDVDDLYRASGNVLLDRVLGATLHVFPVGEDETAADAALERRAEALAAQGRRPYVMHSAPGHRPLGGLGYVLAAAEVMEQAAALGLGFDAVVCPVGQRAHPLRHPGRAARARRDDAGVRRVRAPRCSPAGRAGGGAGGGAGGDDRSSGGVRRRRRGGERRGARAGLRQAEWGGARGDGAGGAARGAASRSGIQRQGDGRSDRRRTFGAYRRRKPGAVHPYRGLPAIFAYADKLGPWLSAAPAAAQR